MAKSKYLEKVEALSKAASTLKIRGQIFEETDDTVTILVGTSLLEIPRKFILSTTEVEGAETKVVDVSINREAKIIQKTLVTPGSAIGAVTGDVFGGIPDAGLVAARCDCQCQCECRCECDCKCHCDESVLGDIGGSLAGIGGIRTSFRTPVRTMSRMSRMM